MSDTLMDLLPSYLMVRTTGRSTTTKRMIQPFLARLALDADIVETSAVPQRHEIAVQAFFVEPVAFLGEDQGLQGILANAARAPKLDGFDDILRRLSGPGGAGWFLGRGWRRGLHRLRGLGASTGACGTVSKGFGGFGACWGCCCCWAF